MSINVGHVLVRFQSVFLSDGTKPCEPFSKKSPDMTCLAELAKVQTRRNHPNRHPVPDWVPVPSVAWAHQQVYQHLHPYPKELRLRNHVETRRRSLWIRRLSNQDRGGQAWESRVDPDRLTETLPLRKQGRPLQSSSCVSGFSKGGF